MRGLIKSLCFLLVLVPTLVLAQGFPPLIVEEIDGSPTGVTTKIKVSNTTLSRSGTVATITIGGGSQTPWTSDINGSTFNLTTTGTINATQLQVAGVNVSTSTYTNSTANNATGWTKSGTWVNTTVAGDNVSISALSPVELRLLNTNTTLTTDQTTALISIYHNDTSTNGAGNKGFIRFYSPEVTGNQFAMGFGTTNHQSTTPTEYMTIASDGRVGINKKTTASDAKLTIYNNVDAVTLINTQGLAIETNTSTANTGGSLVFTRTGQTNFWRLKAENAGGTHYFKLSNYNGTAMNDYLVVSNDGNVGIGDTTPDAQLDVQVGAATTVGQIIQGAASQSGDYFQALTSTGVVVSNLASTGAQTWNFGGDTVTNIAYSTPGGYPGITGTYSSSALWALGGRSGQASWGRGGEYGFKHYTGGYMELGQSSDTTASRAQLDIYNSVGTTKVGLSVQGAASQTGNLQDWRNSTGTVLSCVNATGNVGIGTATPATILDVNGVINATGGNSTYWNAKQGALTNSTGLASALNDETGTGLAVFSTSPAFTTPNIGAATGTSLNLTGGTGVASFTGPNNDTTVTISINTTSAEITAADTFVSFNSTDGQIGSIAGTAVSGVIIYNTFLGGHFTEIEGEIPQIGQVLEITGNVMEKPSHLAKSRICRTPGSNKVYGVYAGQNKEGKHTTLGLGAGTVLAVGDIEPGDLLEADGEGYARKQTCPDCEEGVSIRLDNFILSSTLGKAVQSHRGNKPSMIGVIIYAG